MLISSRRSICREVYAFKSETFGKLWTGRLFKFQCHTKTFYILLNPRLS